MVRKTSIHSSGILFINMKKETVIIFKEFGRITRKVC